MLLLRALVARFWQTPYRGELMRWGTELHDRFMLPHFVAQDMHDVVLDLQRAGYAFEFEWFAPFLEFRFPRYGTVVYHGIEIELRQAIEPWHVLGEEVAAGGTARYRRFLGRAPAGQGAAHEGHTPPRHLQRPSGAADPDRHQAANMSPACATGVEPAVRACTRPSACSRRWCSIWSIRWSGRSIGGCTYHVVHPGGRNYDTFPVNANEAEARRVARFWNHGHTPGPLHVRREGPNPDYPRTLDLRRAPEAWFGENG